MAHVRSLSLSACGCGTRGLRGSHTEFGARTLAVNGNKCHFKGPASGSRLVLGFDETQQNRRERRGPACSAFALPGRCHQPVEAQPGTAAAFWRTRARPRARGPGPGDQRQCHHDSGVKLADPRRTGISRKSTYCGHCSRLPWTLQSRSLVVIVEVKVEQTPRSDLTQQLPQLNAGVLT